MHLNHWFGFVGLSLLVFLAVFQIAGNNGKDFEQNKELVVIRKIGHEILLHSGDSTSRVLPVEQLKKNEYKIQFESKFSFQPDSLVQIIRQIISKHGLPPDYVVNVTESSNDEVIFGYAILGTEQNDIVPCRGRIPPENFYSINLKFQRSDTLLQKKYALPGISILGLTILFLAISSYHKRKTGSGAIWKGLPAFHDTTPKIGRYLFSHGEQYLLIDGEKTELTPKESRILNIFAKAPNQTIARETIQKEVWENEGVIVGRSLDMYISKLRKKLEKDPNVKLVNIHGRGYKLQIG